MQLINRPVLIFTLELIFEVSIKLGRWDMTEGGTGKRLTSRKGKEGGKRRGGGRWEERAAPRAECDNAPSS